MQPIHISSLKTVDQKRGVSVELIHRNASILDIEVFGEPFTADVLLDCGGDVAQGLLKGCGYIEPLAKVKARTAFGKLNLWNCCEAAMIKEYFVRKRNHIATPFALRISSTSWRAQ